LKREEGGVEEERSVFPVQFASQAFHIFLAIEIEVRCHGAGSGTIARLLLPGFEPTKAYATG
jgi:hypothetical protein